MTKYSVDVSAFGYLIVDVDAESEDDAKSKASRLILHAMTDASSDSRPGGRIKYMNSAAAVRVSSSPSTEDEERRRVSGGARAMCAAWREVEFPELDGDDD